MAFEAIAGAYATPLVVAGATLALLAWLFLFLIKKPALSKNVPPLAPGSWPLIGAMQFFTKRWDFCQRAMSASRTGNFSFYAGSKPVIGISSEEGRRIFFDSKSLGFNQGYTAFLAGQPEVKVNNNPLAGTASEDDSFGAYFSKRLVAMMKGNQLGKGLPRMLTDVRSRLDDLANDSKGITDPFHSIYRIVFQLTMRTVACNEIANDLPLMEKTLRQYEVIENAGTPMSVMYPWLPSPAKARRTFAGAKLYMTFKRIIDGRNKTGRRDDDALQYLMDQGDDVTSIITFVLGALFAGQLNSGINAAWMLVYLAHNQYWRDRVLDEVTSVADRYSSNTSLPLKDRLMSLPIEAWEGEFPTIDMCLKDSIRLQLLGAAFRKNISGKDIAIDKAGTEVIPAGAYVTFPVGSIHYNPEIYENPDEWDPARYLPERAEDKKKQFGWIGWGVSRHPCLGMRFAKLENNLIVAMFLAYFDDFSLSDAKGNPVSKPPPVNRNRNTAHKPDEQIYLKYQVRDDKSAA